ncbi:DUF1642 domain-containing protein [Agrilactobacillus fermenti]|uniref:DUF1642 domain-containing protein n=1 Tax=Agrilactobacillus fermenti TaxID=2586909 RepID=UPI001E336439|nr:DUF1642 domain-containing protein [Agrilactobacillus fermenti]MCD2257492.1 DUF1642 domain-containing protein [Agrilactobacillus fermenti]
MKIKGKDLARVTDQNGSPIVQYDLYGSTETTLGDRVKEVNIPDELIHKPIPVPKEVAKYFRASAEKFCVRGRVQVADALTFNYYEMSKDTQEWVEGHLLEYCQAFLTNNYEVKKKEKYYVKVPGTDDSYFVKTSDLERLNAYPSEIAFAVSELSQFTDDEIEKYDLQNYKKEMVMEDENN